LSCVGKFLSNVLPETDAIFLSFIDNNHWANRLRRRLPILNVRSLIGCSISDIDRSYALHGFEVVSRQRLGTGFMDCAVRPQVH
jgi:hypothetical protein